MTRFTKISPYELKDNMFESIGREWMLIGAKDPETGCFNMMTASWGCTGILWNKPVAIAYIRPQRFTFPIADKAESYTLSFFTPEYKDALHLCGKVSGRDHDKLAETGLTLFEDGDYTAFKEARLVLGCKKLYADFIRPEAFIDTSVIDAAYPQRDFHKFFIAEITDVYKR